MVDIVDENINVLYKLLQKQSDGFDTSNQQSQIVQKMISQGSENLLLDLLVNRRILKKEQPAYLDGIIFEALGKSTNQYTINKLNGYFCDGLIDLNSFLKLDYQPLQELLMNQNFKEADKLTQIQLCQLAGLDVNQRKWLYFTDISNVPADDLFTVDMLWRLYSRGKFGFSVQRKIWLSNNCNWEKLWNGIGWKKEGMHCRYPDDFMWTIEAPKGHLPLFNQLRGVQVLSAVFNHIAWTS